MGKKGKKLGKSIIKTGVNVMKNVTPIGVAAGAAKKLGLVKRNPLDDLGKGAQELLGLSGEGGGDGGGGGGGGQDNLTSKYLQAQEEQRLKNLQIGGELTEQLRQQAAGKGPLAGAQLKAAQSRNLAQTLAAAQSGAASPLSARQMLQQRGAQGRELAQLGQQERLGAQQALGAQLGSQAGISRADIESAYGIGMTPVKMAHETQMEREKIQAARDAARRAQQGDILGRVLGAGTSLLAAVSDKNMKKPPTKQASKYSKENNKEDSKAGRKKAFAEAAEKFTTPGYTLGQGVADFGTALIKKLASKGSATSNSPDILSDEQQKSSKKFPNAGPKLTKMLDKLEPSEYEYKDTSLPGTAEGRRYGIMAQDLEKSEAGKSLVKEGPHGKMVDVQQGFGAVLAAQAELNKRLKALEKKKG